LPAHSSESLDDIPDIAVVFCPIISVVEKKDVLRGEAIFVGRNIEFEWKFIYIVVSRRREL